MHQIQEEIGLPKIRVQKVSDNVAIFTVSPLPTGYGTTIGNAFRRVLLSSVPGAAVTGIRIDGITYEYATLKGVKESVLDIMLNLKNLQLKKTNKEVGFATIKALGRNPSAAPKIFMGVAMMLIFAEATSIIALLIIYQLFHP